LAAFATMLEPLAFSGTRKEVLTHAAQRRPEIGSAVGTYSNQIGFRNERSRMKVYLIDNQGSGFADQIEVASGTTVGEFVQQRLRGGDPADHLIRVNRLPTTAEQVLQDGDRVSITPTRIEGAR
jgi:hypothetical protein